MSKKVKIILVAVFAVIVLVAAGVGAFFGIKKINEGKKTFTLEVISERDAYNDVTTVKSELGTLGEYLRTVEGCTYIESDYGIYVQGFNGYMEDYDNSYFWLFYVNDEMAATGADGVVLTDGDKYTFKLEQMSW